MRVIRTALPEVLLLEPKIFADERGFFLESYNRRTFAADTGLDVEFVQDNHSCSSRGVLRGLHYQVVKPQGKLVRCIAGEVLDVAVDLRRASPTFGKWVAFMLEAKFAHIAWIPPGFAHGFLVRSEYAEILYKTTDYYSPEHDRCIVWNDPELGVNWQLESEPVLSPKDRAGKRFRDAELYA